MNTSIVFADTILFPFPFWHKLKIQLQEKTQNTTNLGEPAQLEWMPRLSHYVVLYNQRTPQAHM